MIFLNRGLFFLLLFIFTIMIGCSIKEQEKDDKKNIEVQNEEKNAIQVEIDKFISKIDSVRRSRELQNVILVNFKEKEEKKYLIIRSNYYYPNDFDGYYLTEHYLVVFTGISVLQGNEWIKKYPELPIPDKFRSEDIVNFTPYEPTIRTYELVNSDSIKLISKIR